MRLYACALLAAAVVESAAAPSQPFTVDLAPPANARDFVRDWVVAHRKWGGNDGLARSASTQSLAAADSDREAPNGRVLVNPLGRDDVYVINAAVGNPSQLVKLAFDTSSSKLWTQSSQTVYSVNHDGPWAPRYFTNLSTTAKPQAQSEWEIDFPDGTNATGVTYTDTLRLGTLRVDSVPVQAAVTIPPALENQTDQSGVLGLSKPSTNKTSISSLIRSGLDTPIVSVDLRRNATGRIDFGAVADPTTPLESISWLPGPQPPSERWDVDWETMGWLGGRGGTWHDLPFRATVDTATTLLFLPQGLAGLYWSDVPGMRVDPRLDNAYTFPCNYAGNLPDLLFRLPGSDEGRFVKVPGSYLNYGPVTGDEYGGNSTADGYCWGGMQGAKNLNVAVVGDIMLKAVVVAFDLDKGLVGFANKTLTE